MSLVWRLLLPLLLVVPAFAQEDAPYFVTYDHHLEEPGNLELEMNSTIGVPRSGQRAYFAPFAEIQYGVTRWWTSELYVEGQSTAGDSTVFTGWRLESRFRPFAAEHAINPVFYVEYENINEASRIQKEIVGKAPLAFQPNSELSQAHAHELEAKLILSSDVRHWNIAENLVVERNLSENEGFEFGYAFYIYNNLVAAVDNGARYAAYRTYDSASTTPTSAFNAAVQNMVVYGQPTTGTKPIAPGLGTGNVVLSPTFTNSVPTGMQVSLSGYQLNAIFKTFTLNKPVATYPFLGVYAPP